MMHYNSGKEQNSRSYLIKLQFTYYSSLQWQYYSTLAQQIFDDSDVKDKKCLKTVIITHYK